MCTLADNDSITEHTAKKQIGLIQYYTKRNGNHCMATKQKIATVKVNFAVGI